MIKKQRLNINGREVTFLTKEKKMSIFYHSSLQDLNDPLAHSQYLLKDDFIKKITITDSRIEEIKTSLPAYSLFISSSATVLNSSFLISDSINSIKGIQISDVKPVDSQVLFYDKEIDKLVWRTIDEAFFGINPVQSLATSTITPPLFVETDYSDYFKTNMLHIPYVLEGGRGIFWGHAQQKPELPHYGISLGLGNPEIQKGYIYGGVAAGGMRFTVAEHTGQRGWIFTRVAADGTTFTPVASIDIYGQARFEGSLTIGGNLDNTSGSILMNYNQYNIKLSGVPAEQHGYMLTYDHSTVVTTPYVYPYGKLVLTSTAHTHQGSVDSFKATGVTRNKWYCTPYNGAQLSTQASTANRLYVSHFPVSKNIKVEQIACYVTTLTTYDPLTSVMFGIYDDLNCAPNNNIYSSSFITVDAASRSYSASPMITLTGGNNYWLAIASTSAVTFRSFATYSVIPVLGISDDTFAITAPTYAYSALSAGFTTLPSILDIATMTEDTAKFPAVFVRLSG